MENTVDSHPVITRRRLSPDDAGFILELVNTPDWIKFIGDRKVANLADAALYIQRITSNPDVMYWVVCLPHSATPIGVITFIKRDYLEHPDIGFAFLPGFSGKGYAFDATMDVLHEELDNSVYPHILAITMAENKTSIRLLQKLGFRFEDEIERDGQTLQKYGIVKDHFTINLIVRQFYRTFTNKDGQNPDLINVELLCLPNTIIIKKEGPEEEIYTLSSFIEPRKKILSDGSLTHFEERELDAETRISGQIAQRFSIYEKSGFRNGSWFQIRGNKCFQFVKTKNGWKITALIWEDETDVALPEPVTNHLPSD